MHMHLASVGFRQDTNPARPFLIDPPLQQHNYSYIIIIIIHQHVYIGYVNHVLILTLGS